MFPASWRNDLLWLRFSWVRASPPAPSRPQGVPAPQELQRGLAPLLGPAQGANMATARSRLNQSHPARTFLSRSSTAITFSFPF